MWVPRALNFLVVSCPCALVISIPLGFFGGIGGASKQGILVKGGNYLEALARAGIVVFDKTGTLTRGHLRGHGDPPPAAQRTGTVGAGRPGGAFQHPSPSLCPSRPPAGPPPDPARVTDVKEIAGRGVQAVVDGRTVLAGNQKLMDQFQISFGTAAATWAPSSTWRWMGNMPVTSSSPTNPSRRPPRPFLT